ncbi:MAG: hypothetical protein MR390_03435 [Oscillospiraceae bacterium]|nr:hypothetical protein [Oscillospiraceae bacterium]
MKSEYSIITNPHPNWLNTIVPPEYEDELLYRIILFFVIHSPCKCQSANSISLTERGWKTKPWYSPGYLKDKLSHVIFGDKQQKIKMVNSKTEMGSENNSFNLDENFYNHRDEQRFLFSKISKKDCGNIYMSLFYHIRNSLAHGRLAMYPAKNEDITFVMEDGKDINNNEFGVTARIVINKSSLLKIIDLLEHPPKENDYSDDIVIAINNGINTKSKITKELEIDENTYNKFIKKLKSNNRIEYKNGKWHLINVKP